MAKKSLWDFYDGEPFMENPHIAVVGLNPRSRKKGKKMAAKRRNARRRGRKNAPRRKARRNFPSPGLVFNPRKRRKNAPKRHRRSRRNPVHHARGRRRARRNPALLGVALPPVQMIAFGAGGFIGTPMVEGFINKFLPASVTTSVLGRYAVKIGTVLGLTWLVKTFLSNKEAFPVAMGGSMYIVVSAVNEFAPQLTQTAPAVTAGTHAYRGGMINAYRGGMIATGVPTGMGAYTKGGFGGAMPGLARAMPGLALGPSALLPPYSISNAGMRNPIQADPRFAAFGTTPQ